MLTNDVDVSKASVWAVMVMLCVLSHCRPLVAQLVACYLRRALTALPAHVAAPDPVPRGIQDQTSVRTCLQ